MKKIRIYLRDQVAVLSEEGKEIRRFPISSSDYGVGFEVGSNRTPTGAFRVCQKIGHGMPEGTVFRDRVATGESFDLASRPADSAPTEDLILTRILWLEGCEPQNANTKHRTIYLHGTNQEHLIGTPVSHGCIRLKNRDIVELFDLVDEGMEVDIPAPADH